MPNTPRDMFPADFPKKGNRSLYNELTLPKVKAYMAQCETVPSISGLTVYLGITRMTISNWREAYPEFDEAMDYLLATQEQGLLDKGLLGTYNPNIVKLMLANHGYSDKQDIKHSGAPVEYSELASVERQNRLAQMIEAKEQVIEAKEHDGKSDQG